MLEELFNEIDDVWLAAESGYLYKMGEKHEWKKLISLANKVWLNSIQEIMQSYANNIDGSTVEERESTLVWNYKNAEEEQGNMAVKELQI
jgi:trehalose 6-phosphate synthase/phosphatase